MKRTRSGRGCLSRSCSEWLEIGREAGAAEYRARYVAPADREATIYEGERVVLEELTGAPGGAASG